MLRVVVDGKSKDTIDVVKIIEALSGTVYMLSAYKGGLLVEAETNEKLSVQPCKDGVLVEVGETPD